MRPANAPRLDPTWASPADDPYAALVMAVVGRAVQDAQGHCSPTRGAPPAMLRQEARAWLQDEDAVRNLLELCGYDAAPVLRRIQQLLDASAPTSAEPQLTLF